MTLLTKKEEATLKICLEHFRKDLLWIIENNNTVLIDKTLGNKLQDAVGDELLHFGFDGDEPNSYGLLLESLINSIGNQFIL